MDIHSPQQGVQIILAAPFIIMGASHIVRPEMWRSFFKRLNDMGQTGVVIRSFMLELWPAALIIAFHQDWSGPGVILTVYGHMLMTKVALSLVLPQIGSKSLQMAQSVGKRGFIGAGVALLGLGALCVLGALGVVQT